MQSLFSRSIYLNEKNRLSVPKYGLPNFFSALSTGKRALLSHSLIAQKSEFKERVPARKLSRS